MEVNSMYPSYASTGYLPQLTDPTLRVLISSKDIMNHLKSIRNLDAKLNQVQLSEVIIKNDINYYYRFYNLYHLYH